MNRRKFLGRSAATAGLLILKSKTAFGYEANSAVRYALLGCGKRGTTVATSFAKNTDARIVALADIFPDQLAKARTHFDEVNAGLGHPAIDPKLMFRGYTAFQQLAASSDVDAIQISTPPFFHVEHLDGVVSAGKHAYCEKPVGVDIAQDCPGTRDSEASRWEGEHRCWIPNSQRSTFCGDRTENPRRRYR
jgi:myo-inositol 2-dehydrogenase / D-chiro-inositol 1-dehydrogenase